MNRKIAAKPVNRRLKQLSDRRHPVKGNGRGTGPVLAADVVDLHGTTRHNQGK
jgi:hypothetical protein